MAHPLASTSDLGYDCGMGYRIPRNRWQDRCIEEAPGLMAALLSAIDRGVCGLRPLGEELRKSDGWVRRRIVWARDNELVECIGTQPLGHSGRARDVWALTPTGRKFLIDHIADATPVRKDDYPVPSRPRRRT